MANTVHGSAEALPAGHGPVLARMIEAIAISEHAKTSYRCPGPIWRIQWEVELINHTAECTALSLRHDGNTLPEIIIDRHG